MDAIEGPDARDLCVSAGKLEKEDMTGITTAIATNAANEEKIGTDVNK